MGTSSYRYQLQLTGMPVMVPALAGREGFDLLVEDIAEDLALRGSVVVAAGDLQVTSRLWRHAARAAARRLGCRVATGRSGGGPILATRVYPGPDGWSVWAQLLP